MCTHRSSQADLPVSYFDLFLILTIILVADFFFSRSRLRPGRIRIQKTCRSDFSSSASAESGNPRGNRACSAAESALKLVDLSRIGQIRVNSNSEVPEVLIEISKKPENLRTFEFSNFRTQFSVE